MHVIITGYNPIYFSILLICRRTYRIAFSSVCPQTSLLDVQLAVVGRVLEVDQVGVRVGLEPLEAGQQHPPTAPLLLLHLVGGVELLLQNLANLETKIHKEDGKNYNYYFRGCFLFVGQKVN